MNEQEFRHGVKAAYDEVVAEVVAQANADTMAAEEGARIEAFYAELRQLRAGVIALHETLTRQTFPPEASGMSTGEILEHLLAGARELLDRAEQEHKAATGAAASAVHRLKTMAVRSDAITRHLAEALVLYTSAVDEPAS